MSAPPLFSIDTHALYWFEMGLPHLSGAVVGVFDDAAKGIASLLIHPMLHLLRIMEWKASTSGATTRVLVFDS